MKRKLFVFLILAVYARALSLDDAIRATVESHPDIKTFALQVDSSQKDEDGIKSELLPQVNLKVLYDPKATFALPANGAFSTVDDKNFVTTLSLNQKIFDFSKTSTQKRAYAKNKESSSLLLEDAKNYLAYKTKLLYKQIVITKELFEVNKKDVELKESYYNQALSLQKQGFKTVADSSRLLVALMEARETLASTSASLEHLLYKLSLYTKQKIDSSSDFDREVIFANKEVLRVNKDDLLLVPKIQIEQKNIEKNDLLYESSYASHFGSFDFHASYSRYDTLSRYNSSVVGFEYNLPIFSGGKIDASAQRAKLQTKIAKEQKESKLLALEEDLDLLFTNLDRLEFSIKAKQSSVDAAKDAHDITLGRYKAGLSTYIELLDASNALLSSKIGLLDAYYTKSITIDEIDYLEGKK